MPKYLHHLIALLMFIAAGMVFFFPQFQGRVIPQGDILSYKAASKELRDWKEKTGHQPLWTNSMFSGMPAYPISMDRSQHPLSYLRRALGLFFDRPMGYFLVGMIGMYLLFLVLGVDWLLASFGAITVALMTNNLILWEAGHTNKIATLMYTGFVLGGIILTYTRRYFLGGGLFLVGIALALFSNHPQMLYYLALSSLIYVLLTLREALRHKTIADFIKASGILLIGSIIGILGSIDALYSLYTYNKHTMRGEPILHEKADPTSSSSVKGLAWDYAMQWSHGWLDQLSTFIPGMVGGSSSEVLKPNSTLDRAIRQRTGQRLKRAPLYWGSLPFTSGPPYMGAVLWFFFVMGLFLVRGTIKWWIALSVLLTFMIAMGKNLAWFNKLLFDYLPLFNNFRTPNSVLSVTSFLMPILSIVTLHGIATRQYKPEEVLRALKYSSIILGGLALGIALLGPSIFDFRSAADEQFRQAGLLDALIQERQSLLRRDALRTFFFIALAAAAVWAHTRGVLKKTHFILGIGALMFVDIVDIGKRYLQPEAFVPRTKVERQFEMRPADREILKDKSLYYRVLDLSVNTFNSSLPSYYHKTVGGYSAAKLQRYQDLIDYHIARNNPKVLNMLNTKYIITRDGSVRLNPNALGNAWAVKKLITVQSPDEEINALNHFNPSEEAIIEANEKAKLPKRDTFSGNAQIHLVSYAPDRLEYQFVSDEDQFVVFSEIWYPEGWKATIDGAPAPLVKVNYALRGLYVPAGKHQIVMVFEPDHVLRAFSIAHLVGWSIITLVIVSLLYYLWKQKTKEQV